MVDRPKPTAGMHHVALVVRELEACERFYCELLGMQVEWRPDPDNVYLSSGNDNLALHRADADSGVEQSATQICDDTNNRQTLDHIGFIVREPEQVDAWHDYLVEQAVKIIKAPRTHRDGARSFYCKDPEGVTVQFIFHPPLVGKL